MKSSVDRTPQFNSISPRASRFARVARSAVFGAVVLASLASLGTTRDSAADVAVVKGGKVTRVDFGIGNAKAGSFVRSGDKAWTRFDARGEAVPRGFASYTEASSSDVFVNLVNPMSRDIVEIDVQRKMVFESDNQALKHLQFSLLSVAYAPGAPPAPPQPSVAAVAVPPPGAAHVVYADEPDMTDADKAAIMHWIQVKTTEAQLPFCWRQSSGRGVGQVPGRVADCPAGYTNNGATCGRGADTYSAPSKLADCPSGYTNMGLTCYQGPSTYGKGCTTIFKKYQCNEGYTDDGCFCGKGASSLSASSMVCPKGYHKSDITKRCIVDCRDGYTNTGETCFKPVATLGMDSMTCKPGEHRSGARCYPNDSACGAGHEEDAGLCYPTCPANFHGEGPVCWQNCDAGWVNCGAGCGKTKNECGSVVAGEVLATLAVAANIATLGISSGETAAAERSATAETVSIGGRSVVAGSAVAKAFLKVVKALQTIKPANLPKDATLVKTVYAARMGTKLKKGVTAFKVSEDVYSARNQFADAYADDFAKQTSPEINREIDTRFEPMTARFIKKQWALQSANRMAAAHDFEIASDVLAAVSIADITGTTALVASFAKPICQDVIAFPALSQSYK